MKRILILLLAALVVDRAAPVSRVSAAEPPTVPPPVKRLLALEDMARFREVTDPRVSPDGAWVAYTVTTQNLEADLKQSDLWMTSWDGATTQRLTATLRESETQPRWSPDGRSLSFLSSREDARDADQVWVLPRAGGEAERVSAFTSSVIAHAWAPDGARIVCVVADSDSVAIHAVDGEEGTRPPIVIDRLYFKEDETGYLTHQRRHLHLLNRATGRAEQLTRGDQDDVSPAWSPDGRTIAFLSKRGPDADRTNSWEVHVVEARPGAEVRPLTRFEGLVNNPGGEGPIAWSPDGTHIAFLQGGPEQLIYYAVDKLAVVPVAGGAVRVLTADLDRWISDLAWTGDGRFVHAVLEEDRARHLIRIPAAGGRPEPVLAGRRAVTAFDVGRSGRIAALVATSATLPEVFALSGRETRALSRQNDSLLAVLELGAVEEIGFESRDGTPIHGFMVRPPDHRAGIRHPTILRIHGGPVGQYMCSLQLEWQLLASRGYAVVTANPRGSSGRGQAFARAIFADWGNKDAQDVIAAVDHAIARGVADPERLGIGGWSYGGMLTNYVIVQDTRFKAATSGASIANVLAGYGTDMYLRQYEAELGTPWEATDAYLRLSSPFLHADRIVTPTLFLCGEKDFDVPLLNSEQMYQALRSLGRETQLVIYPGQTHGLTRPSYLADRFRRYLAWYERYLK